MRRCSLVLFALAGCAFEPRGGDEVDAARIDAAITDADVDGAELDAADVDAAGIDAAMIDAPEVDAAMIDAAMIDAPAIDAATDAPTDASIDAPPPIDIAYLPAADEMPGTGSVVINGNQAISTNVGAPLPNLGTGVTFTVATPTGGGSDIVVLHVDQFTIGNAGTLRVAGTRPFAIVAGGAVTINGVLDLSAAGQTTAGAGGFASSTGTGQGTDGRHGGTRTDSGGGGAGHGTAGQRGGNALCVEGCTPDVVTNGGEAGPLYNNGLTQLVGGSGGGNAVLTALGCDGQPGGAGGGSGGQIDLPSPMVVVTGTAAANGGGGGGGAEGGTGDGVAGEDGRNDGNAAQGGPGMGGSGGDGGAGGTGSAPPVQGEDLTDDDNGGGGGGAVGHVVIRFRGSQPTITASPPATYIAY